MDIVEIEVIQGTLVVATKAARKRSHADFFSIRDDSPFCLQNDEPLEKLDNRLFLSRRHVVETE
jgi:hypothetical protein